MCTINNLRTGNLRLHDGVLRDVEQQQRRKHENTYSLQQQIDITKQLKAKEASSNSPNTPIPPPITPSQGNLQAETDTNATQTPSSQEAELQQQGVEGSEEVLQAKAEAANQDAPSPPSDNI
ncbi:uncharacterized protein LOC108091556 isoform X2 [Drosophila ficusphila]|uniref:uncharacterized protein LOC108091556 isoform X2 n=1 Tax=Drosophila ficusphila TaxID=30025 RepID=UPI0007E70EDC|nr:uncharacterized protein LOC108091556 isoform X2 [Drosophila ficusphila]